MVEILKMERLGVAMPLSGCAVQSVGYYFRRGIRSYLAQK